MANEISLENVLRRCGDLGRFQMIHYLFLNLITLGSGITTYYYVFGCAEPSFRCRLPASLWSDDYQYQPINLTHQYLIFQSQRSSNCEDFNGSVCRSFLYDRRVFGRTFTEDGDYVCQSALKKTWLSTMYQIGGFVVLLSGYIGDRIGRRKMIRILTVILYVIPLATQILLQSFSLNDDAKFILLSINQLFSSIDAYAMVFLLLMELTSSSHTSLAGNSALVGFTLGEAIITLFAYLARDWLRLKWIITGYFTLVLPYLYFVPESPYWLFSKKKYNQLEAYLRNIAQRNGRADHEWYPLFRQLVQDPRLAILSTKHASRTSKDVIIHHLKRLSICAFIGFVTMLLYIKISYGLGTMGNGVSPYWSIIIGAVVEAIGYVTASILITTRLGRKYSLILFSSCTALCVFIIPFLMKSYPFSTTVISQIGKLTISGGVSITWIYIPEIFPTSIRGVANGVFVFAGRLGAILAPIVDVALGEKYLKFTFFTYSAWTVILVILVYFLPETRNRSFHTDEDEEANGTVQSTKEIDGDGRGISNDAMTPSTPRAPHHEKLDNFHTKF